MKILIKILILIPFYFKSQPFFNGEIFIGEVISTIKSEPVYLGDSVVFYLNQGERFYTRCEWHSDGNIIAHITRKDGSNGTLNTKNIHKSDNQTFFKITYNIDYYPFAKIPNIYATSKYSNCTYRSISYWQKYFHDSTDFIGLTFKAYNKDTVTLFKLLTFNNLDCDGQGQWSVNNWKIINNYTDKELATFLFNHLDPNRTYYATNLIQGYAIVSGIFGDENNLLLNYYETNYPLVYEIFKLDRYYESKVYKAQYKKLKKQLFKQ